MKPAAGPSGHLWEVVWKPQWPAHPPDSEWPRRHGSLDLQPQRHPHGCTDHPRRRLELASAKRLRSGAVAMPYRRAPGGKDGPGWRKHEEDA